MDLIDVTLRDGGHAVKFDWDLETARKYYKTVSEISDVTYIELGYWKQTAKSVNMFYNLDLDKVKQIVTEKGKDVCVMIDYHYCSKDLNDYPTNKEQDIIKMIRVCSRKSDIPNAVEFIDKLKKHTGLKVSLNVFNVSNYTKLELDEIASQIKNSDLDYVYFADTHGTLDFEFQSGMFTDAVALLKDHGIKVGMHLHDHSGKAISNFKKLTEIGFTGFDASTRGMGKGVGNLKLEHVIKSDGLNELLQFVFENEGTFTMRESPYGIITAKHSVTDYYGYHAEKMGISMSRFDEICSGITGEDKDVFNINVLEGVK